MPALIVGPAAGRQGVVGWWFDGFESVCGDVRNDSRRGGEGSNKALCLSAGIFMTELI